MKAGKTAKLLFVLAAIACLTGMASMAAIGGEPPKKPAGGGVDTIVIANLEEFGALTERGVTYNHGVHAEAVQKAGKDCTVCHQKDEKGRLSPRYMRLKNLDGGKLKVLYHDTCVACHRDMGKGGKKTGPVEAQCRECHASKPAPAAKALDASLDPNLHARHVKAADEKCETCHHKYDEAQKKLVYAKGEEGTCRYCHGQKTVETKTEKRVAFKQAGHEACVSCHFDTLKKGKDSGPVACVGCHTAEAKAKYKRFQGELPRLKRNQPDVVLLGQAIADKPKVDDDARRSKLVAFPHQAHEKAEVACRACHHASLASCSAECHTVAGSEKGKFVTLAQSMHKTGATASCVGCHDQQKKAPQCAGCHVMMPTTGARDGQCSTCHKIERTFNDQGGAAKLPKADADAMAAKALSDSKRPEPLADADIPEKVTIKVLANKYEPSEMPHRQIVRKLEKGLKDSGLAGAYHQSQLTVCQGCHHHAEATKKPAACASCHRDIFDAQSKARIGLVGAYHQQCIGCHTAMKLEKPAATDCAGCHKEKKK